VADNENGSSKEQQNVTEERKEKKGVLYIGIDLGTSRTSIAASNGVRETVWSYVGYPKDVVSKKLLKKDKLFGKEAVEKRLSLDLFRPFQAGAIKFMNSEEAGIKAEDLEKHLQAAKDLVKHAIQLAKPRKDELIFAVLGAPAKASVQNKQALIDAVKGQVDSIMVCSEPFAVAYGLDLLDDTLVIDIGAGTVDLCRMHGTMPAAEDQITLTTAGDWLDQQLYAILKKKIPEADFTIHYVKEVKEKYAFVGDAVDPVLVEFLVNGKPTMFDITHEVREACRMIIPPIVTALHKLISSFDPDFQKRLRDHVLLGGGGSQIIGLGRVLEETMVKMLGSGKVTHVDEPAYAGCNGALKMAHDMPEEYWKRLSNAAGATGAAA
jgi:rod shape-determining protein MreB and related proteins